MRRPRLLPALAATVVLAVAGAHAVADAPKAGGQAPGWYRMTLGGFEITALNDGTVDLPVDQLLTNITPERVGAMLDRAHLHTPLETSVNGYLVNTGRKLVLIDAGAAGLFGPTLGRLVDNLKASGYRPDQVDEVYLTHMHPDHVGGLVADGQRVFPNAVVRADRREGGFWLSKASMDAAPKEAQGFFQGAMASLQPYVAAGRLQPFDGETELMPGIRALPAYGHTPGHTVYVVESQGQRMVMWGDVMHVAAVQFPLPMVTIQFDTDSARAAPVRAKAFSDAAGRGDYVAVAHVPFPGIGRLRSDGSGGYDWLPANYTRPRP
jgi:glyoxylase-like metal-dependent hydrolase (beta-lactamase superfamily II)